jgi:hypothetical protein
VVVRDLDTPCRVLAPLEAYPPLVVDADAMLATSIALQCLEAVARRNAQVIELPCGIDCQKLGPRAALNPVREIPDRMAHEQRGRSLIGEAPDHAQTYR